MYIKDVRFEHVYCTNCKHWLNLLKYIENEDKFTPKPCYSCYPYNPEDSTRRIDRPYYEEMMADETV